MNIGVAFEGVVAESGISSRLNFEGFGAQLPTKEIHQAGLYIKILREQNHVVKVITKATASEAASQWLHSRHLSIDVTSTEHRGLDMLVDDDLSELLPHAGLVRHLLLFSSESNHQHVLPRGIQRVNDWWEIYNYIREGGF
ncbi:MAG: hypothetical protein RL292_145 [Candidatus Parcubacteria bacterium]